MSTDAEKPSRTFLTKLYAKLKDLVGDKVSKDDFDSAVKHARAHAGGVAKAEKSKAMAESLTDFIDKVQTALYNWFSTGWNGMATFSWAREVYSDHVIACSNVDGKDYQIPFQVINDEIQFGDPVEVEIEYVVVGANEIADMCADGRGMRLFNEFHFATPPEWFNFLPKPGKYESPRYGEIVITEERNQNFIDNFTNKVYQEKLPIDCEHDIGASGAVGWIVGMRLNSDGSVDAKADWNDRGKELIEGDRFKYFSPSWFSVWTDPVEPDKQITDVAIGGALTIRPFFKEKALRPLIANEQGISVFEGNPKNLKDEGVVILNFAQLTRSDKSTTEADMPEEKKTGAEPKEAVDPQKFAEVQTQLTEARTKLTATETELADTKTKLTAAEEKATKSDERIGNLEKAARATRFSELSKGWVGDQAKHVKMLEHFATSDEKGEESEMFKDYVETQKAAADQLANSKIFTEIGSSAPAEGSAAAKIAAGVKAAREADPKLTEAQAFDQVWEKADPGLRQQFREEDRRSVN